MLGPKFPREIIDSRSKTSWPSSGPEGQAARSKRGCRDPFPQGTGQPAGRGAWADGPDYPDLVAGYAQSMYSLLWGTALWTLQLTQKPKCCVSKKAK